MKIELRKGGYNSGTPGRRRGFLKERSQACSHTHVNNESVHEHLIQSDQGFSDSCTISSDLYIWYALIETVAECLAVWLLGRTSW